MISSLSSLDLNTTTIALGQYNNISNNSNNDSYYGNGPVFPPYIRTTATVLCSLIMGIGVLGNVMVPIVIFKSKDMRNSTNVFLMNLSFADLMVLLVCTPTVLVEVNSQPETWILGEEMCKAVPFIEMMVTHASVLTILAISFERYYAICEPLKAGYICTKARAFFICVCAWALAALLTSPMLFIPEYRMAMYHDGSWVPVCLSTPNALWRELFFYLSNSLFFWVPLVILLVLYSIIAIHLMADPGIKGSETFSHRARSQLVLMLGTVVLSFFLCLMPFRVFILWYISASSHTITSLGVEKFYNLLYFCRTMSYVHSAINPILYNLMSSKFRDGFMKICGLRSGRLLLRHRRWGFTNSMNTTTTSMSFSSSRRDRDHFGSAHYHYRGSPDFSRSHRISRNSRDFYESRILSREASRRTVLASRTQEDFSPILKHVSRKSTTTNVFDPSLNQCSQKNRLEKLERESLSCSESPALSQYGDLSNHSGSDDAEVRFSLALSEYDNIEKNTVVDIFPEYHKAILVKSKSEEDVMRMKVNKNPPDRGKDEMTGLDDILVPNFIQNEVPEAEESSCILSKAEKPHVRNDSIRRSILKSRMQRKMTDDNGAPQVSNGSLGRSHENYKDHELIKFSHNSRQKGQPESHV